MSDWFMEHLWSLAEAVTSLHFPGVSPNDVVGTLYAELSHRQRSSVKEVREILLKEYGWGFKRKELGRADYPLQLPAHPETGDPIDMEDRGVTFAGMSELSERVIWVWGKVSHFSVTALAKDKGFNPDRYSVRQDDKPKRESKCLCCGVLYAPDGVCGYCRAEVKRLRSKE